MNKTVRVAFKSKNNYLHCKLHVCGFMYTSLANRVRANANIFFYFISISKLNTVSVQLLQSYKLIKILKNIT
jgi:hypothetical protein